MNVEPLEVFLFAPSVQWLERGAAAGLSSFIIDWESRGKETRQLEADTEVNCDTPDDLRRLRDLGIRRRICRINAYGAWTSAEIENAIDAGATDLFLPMVRRSSEIDAAWRQIGGRCRLGILVETTDAVRNARELARTPIDFVYIGLNDLAISRKSASLFDSLVDGTVDAIREAFADVPFGCGGLTAIDCGYPLRFSLLIRELSRLRCEFVFARRSFRRDMEYRDIASELQRIQVEWARLAARSSAEIEQDRRQFSEAVRQITVAPAPLEFVPLEQ